MDYDRMSDTRLMERVRAARALVDAQPGDDSLRRFAAMSLLNPEKKMTRAEVDRMFER